MAKKRMGFTPRSDVAFVIYEVSVTYLSEPGYSLFCFIIYKRVFYP